MQAPRSPTNKAEFEQELKRVDTIIKDPQKYKELVETTGDGAQEWLDLLQLVSNLKPCLFFNSSSHSCQLAEYPDLPKKLRSSIFKTMIRLSRNSRLHPNCLTIQAVERLGDYPEAGGAYGDVWKGRVGGNLVCLKMIRAFSSHEVEQVLRVRAPRRIVACQTEFSMEYANRITCEKPSYGIFAGHVPFLGLSEAAVLCAVYIENKRPTRPEGLSPSHDSLWSMIVACWDADPASRPTMVDVLTRLAAMNAERNRTFEPASEWDNPRYTQIWNDIQHPTVLQAGDSSISLPSVDTADSGQTKAREEKEPERREVSADRDSSPASGHLDDLGPSGSPRLIYTDSPHSRPRPASHLDDGSSFSPGTPPHTSNNVGTPTSHFLSTSLFAVPSPSGRTLAVPIATPPGSDTWASRRNGYSYSRSVPAPSLLEDISSIWFNNPGAANGGLSPGAGSPLSVGLPFSPERVGGLGNGTPGNLGYSILSDSFVDNDQNGDNLQKPDLLSSGSNTNAARPISSPSPTPSNDDSHARLGSSPASRALIYMAHAPRQSLPRGLGFGYSRIHALPPPSLWVSPESAGIGDGAYSPHPEETVAFDPGPYGSNNGFSPRADEWATTRTGGGLPSLYSRDDNDLFTFEPE
ncbi:hypothetical protein V5O48_015152 [Marasmius crinis-equi]|uniref:Uncharacterized protein n=1 Tax=Marasmius crinis-equi TaxID=585013 RepID=A0ABR3EVC0_9AGAR